MSTPQLTDAVEGRQAPDAAQSVQPLKAATDNIPDRALYIDKACSWNDLPLQPWRIAVLVQADKMYAVLERKELQFDLLDWFEDARVGAVMRGEKIVSQSEFWFELFRQSIGAIQQHFGPLPVRVLDTMPTGKHTVIFGNKNSNHLSSKPLPSPVAVKQPSKTKKRNFKHRT